MHWSIARVSFAIMALLMLACEASKNSPMVSLVEEQGYETAWEQYRRAARPSPRGGLIAEGDLYFASEDDLREYFDERMLEDVDKAHAFLQDSTGYVPKFEWPAQRNIRYCVSNAFSSKATWVARIADAARSWERIANVRFVYLSAFDGSCTAAQSGVDFAVIRADDGDGYYACNKMLWDEIDVAVQCPTAQAKGVLEIDTNLDLTFNGQATSLTATGILRHELGHILGLRHEHPWRGFMTPPCPEMPAIPALDLDGLQLTEVAYDPYSVMHYRFFVCAGEMDADYYFTKTDVFSIHRLYDMPTSWVDTINSVVVL